MMKRVLALGSISLAVGFAQAPAPAPAKAKPAAAAAKPAAAAKSAAPFVAPKTPWGEPDLQGIWPLNHLISVGLQRPARYNGKAMLTDEEVSKAQDALDQRNSRFEGAAIPVADTSKRVMKQTSLIIDPPDGQFPALTEYGKQVQAQMKSSYKPGQTVFDAIEDFASWDRCITRGMPVTMEPRNYNNGIQIVQSPGYVVIFVEMAHEARIIPTTKMPDLDPTIKQWLGEPRGHWEGNTLVVESKNFNGLTGQTSAGVPGSPGPLQPETTDFHVVERFTRTAADTIEFKMTVDDPKVMTRPYTVSYPMFLDNTYDMYEYACHEGNTAVRNYIETSRFERGVKVK